MPKPPEFLLKREFREYQKEIEKRMKLLEKGAKEKTKKKKSA